MEFDEFKESLPNILGDDYYSDPEKTKPTKAFDDVHDFDTLAKNYVNTKRLVGKKDAEFAEKLKGMVKVPGENATEEEIKAYRTARGVPDKADNYELPVPATASDLDKKGFAAVAAAIKPIAHEVGISPSNLAKVWSKTIEVLTAQNAEIDQKGRELLDADIKAMQEKHKEKYDSFIKAGNDGLAKFNVENNPVGENFRKLLDSFGILNSPAVREFLFAVSELVLPGSSHLAPGIAGGEGPKTATGFDYSKEV